MTIAKGWSRSSPRMLRFLKGVPGTTGEDKTPSARPQQPKANVGDDTTAEERVVPEEEEGPRADEGEVDPSARV